MSSVQLTDEIMTDVRDSYVFNRGRCRAIAGSSVTKSPGSWRSLVKRRLAVYKSRQDKVRAILAKYFLSN
jgi:hypothetical protein